MRDDQGSAVGRRCEECFHETVCGGCIEVLGGLVDCQNGSRGSQCTRHEESTTLASRYGRSPGTDDRVDPLGEGFDPLVEACPREQVRGLVSGQRGARHAEVLVDGGCEDVGVLGRHRDVCGELVTVRSPGWYAVDESCARLGWDDAREGCEQRRLSDAGGTHDGERGTGAQRQRDAGRQGRPARPTDRQVACLDHGRAFRNAVGLGGHLVVQQSANSLCCLGAAHQLGSRGSKLGDPLERRERNEDDDREEYLSERARRGLRDADEEGTDDGCAHRTHVEASG